MVSEDRNLMFGGDRIIVVSVLISDMVLQLTVNVSMIVLKQAHVA